MNAAESRADGTSGSAASRMSRVLRRALIAAGAVAVVVLVLFSVARAMFPAARLRELAVTKLEQATGLDISVRDARISFVHWRLGVRVSDIEVSRPEDGAKLAVVPRAGATLALLALFRREIVVTEVYVDKPRVEIVAKKPREAGPAADAGEGRGAAPAVSFQVPKAVISDGEVVFRDPVAGREVRLEGLEVTSSAKAGPKFETVTSDGKFSIRRVSVASLAKGEAILPDQSVRGDWKTLVRLKQEVLELKRVFLTVAEVPIEVTGLVGLAERESPAGTETAGGSRKETGPDVDLKIVMKNVELEKLASLVPGKVAFKVGDSGRGGTLNVESRVAGRVPSPRVDTRFNLTAGSATRLDGRLELSSAEPRELVLETDGTLRLEELQSLLSAGKGPRARTGDVTLRLRATAPLEGLKKNPYSVQALGQVLARNVRIETGQAASDVVVEKLNVSLAGRRAEVSQTVVGLGSSTFNVSGIVPDWSKRSFQLVVHSPFLNLKELLEPPPPGGEGVEKKAAAGPLLPLGALGMQGAVEIKVDRLTYGKFEARDLDAKVHMAGDSLSVTKVTMRALGGEAGGKARLKVPRDGAPTYTAAFSGGNLQLAALLDTLTPLKGVMTGVASLEVELGGALGKEPLPLKSITAQGGVRSSQATAIAGPVVSALASWVGLDSRKEYAVKDFATSFSVRDGRLIVPACSLVEKHSTWNFSGSTGLDGSLDQKVNVVLSPEYSKRVDSLKGLAHVLKDERGRVVVDLFLGGTVKKPALRWDSARMERRAKDYLAGRMKREMEKQIEEKLGITPEARRQLEQKADSLKKEASEAGKKLLEELMKKK